MPRTVIVARPQRTVPRPPSGRLQLEPPPEPERVVPTGPVQRLLPVVMLAGSVVYALYDSGTLTTPDPHTSTTIETWANWAPTVVALVIAMKFTKTYPDRYRARMEAAQRQS